MVFVIVLVVLVVLIVAAGLALRRKDVSTQTFPGPVTAVDVRQPAGGVRFIAGGDGGATVTREMRWLVTKPKLEETCVDGTLTLHVTGSPLLSGIVEYTVQVPAGASVTAWSSAGTIHVRGVRGGVTARSSAGGIFLEECGGELRLKTSAGTIEGEDLTSPDVEVDTSAGSVDLVFVAPPERVQVETSAGSVELVVPDDRYRVETSTGAGSATIEVTNDPDAARHISVKTSAGSVRVTRH